MSKGAVLLIKAKDNENSDPKKNECVCWKKWDPVNVHPIDWKFGRMESFPRFYKVFITDASPAEISRFIVSHKTRPITLGDDFTPLEQRAEMLLRSKYQFRGDDLSNKHKSELRKTGETRMTYATFKKYIKNKVTGITADKED
jgi:hypothetical protein